MEIFVNFSLKKGRFGETEEWFVRQDSSRSYQFVSGELFLVFYSVDVIYLFIYNFPKLSWNIDVSF